MLGVSNNWNVKGTTSDEVFILRYSTFPVRYSLLVFFVSTLPGYKLENRN